MKEMLPMVMAPARGQSGGVRIKIPKDMGWEKKGRERGELKGANLKRYMANMWRGLYTLKSRRVLPGDALITSCRSIHLRFILALSRNDRTGID